MFTCPNKPMIKRKIITPTNPPSEAVIGVKKHPNDENIIPNVTKIFGSYLSANHPAGTVAINPPTNKAENMSPCS